MLQYHQYNCNITLFATTFIDKPKKNQNKNITKLHVP